MANGFDPTRVLTDFDGGSVSTLPSGRTLHEYRVVAQEKSIEVVPGIRFTAWTYNGRVPGPSFRVRESDRVRIRFINTTSHPHSMHFHARHALNEEADHQERAERGRADTVRGTDRKAPPASSERPFLCTGSRSLRLLRLRPTRSPNRLLAMEHVQLSAVFLDVAHTDDQQLCEGDLSPSILAPAPGLLVGQVVNRGLTLLTVVRQVILQFAACIDRFGEHPRCVFIGGKWSRGNEPIHPAGEVEVKGAEHVIGEIPER